MNITHDFHVLNRNFNIAMDRIIGNDFLIKTNANIDFATKTISLEKPCEMFTNKIFEMNNYSEKEKLISKFKIHPLNEKQKDFSKSNNADYYDAMNDLMITFNMKIKTLI